MLNGSTEGCRHFQPSLTPIRELKLPSAHTYKLRRMLKRAIFLI